MPANQGQGIHQHLNALGVPFGSPHQPVQLALPHRMQPFIPVHCPAFAHHMTLRRKPPQVHGISVAAVQSGLPQPFIQPQKGSFTTVPHLEIHPAASVALPHHRRPNPQFLPVIPPPDSPVSPHLITGHRHRRTAARHPFHPRPAPFPQPAQGLPPPFLTQLLTACALTPTTRPTALRLLPSTYIRTACSLTLGPGR